MFIPLKPFTWWKYIEDKIRDRTYINEIECEGGWEGRRRQAFQRNMFIVLMSNQNIIFAFFSLSRIAANVTPYWYFIYFSNFFQCRTRYSHNFFSHGNVKRKKRKSNFIFTILLQWIKNTPSGIDFYFYFTLNRITAISIHIRNWIFLGLRGLDVPKVIMRIWTRCLQSRSSSPCISSLVRPVKSFLYLSTPLHWDLRRSISSIAYLFMIYFLCSLVKPN